MSETPAVLYVLVAALGIRAVAFEWSHDELDGHVGRSLASGTFDFHDYWGLPASSELFAGDGRITAGHFALLERLRAEDLLDQLILYDRLDPDPPPEWHVRRCPRDAHGSNNVPLKWVTWDNGRSFL